MLAGIPNKCGCFLKIYIKAFNPSIIFCVNNVFVETLITNETKLLSMPLTFHIKWDIRKESKINVDEFSQFKPFLPIDICI